MRKTSKLSIEKLPTAKEARKRRRKRLGIIDQTKIRIDVRISRIALDAIDSYLASLNKSYDKLNRTRLIELGIFMVTHGAGTEKDDIDKKFKKYWKE